MNETLTIGQLAQRFGLNTSAIRYYEANGVLPEPTRVSGQRRYGPDAVRRLEVLDVAKRAGFSLDEVRVLLQSAEAGTPAFEALRELAAHKLPDVESPACSTGAFHDEPTHQPWSLPCRVPAWPDRRLPR
jgi:MerR family transcriptional regulator, redox-sensitive transcriptional activator SoxR